MCGQTLYIGVMTRWAKSFKHFVAAFVLLGHFAHPAAAQQATLDDLYADLFTAGEEEHESIANRIERRWQQSGSASMDLLYRRGSEALEEGEPGIAAEHFSALIDHAPDFAEGYHGRASAYFQLDLIGPALDDLAQTLVLEPRHFKAMFGVGALFEGLDRPDRALAIYEEILKIYPLDPQALAGIERVRLVLNGQDI